MKKIICMIVLLIVCLTGVFAVDFTPYAGLDYDFSIYQGFIGPNGGIEVTFKKWLGVGAEAQALFGTTYGDSYLNAILYGRLWIFTLGGGITTQLSEGTLPAGSEYDTMVHIDEAVTPCLMTGLDIPLFSTGPVSWALTTSLDVIVTDFPFETVENENWNFMEYLVANFISIIFQAMLGGSIGSIKGAVGVQASF